MCKCTPEIRTPFCCRDGCLPPASRESTESLFAANAEREFARMAHGDHLAHFKADQLDAWERRLAQFSNRSDSTGYAGRMGLEVLSELRRLLEQADALAVAVEAEQAFWDSPLPDALTYVTETRRIAANTRAALKAFREGR